MFAEWDGDEEHRDPATAAKHTHTRSPRGSPAQSLSLSGMSNVLGVAHECHGARSLAHPQPRVHISSTDDAHDIDIDTDRRPGSATSSLDPYYFGADSPVAHSPHEPLTPARDIDRKGLVGVGELATPRWDKSRQSHADDSHLDDDVVVVNDSPDSPWTIEAVDGESDEVIISSAACRIHFITFSQHQPKPLPRTIRQRCSMGEESGGEEILYPRKPHASGFLHPSDAVKTSSPSPEEPPSPLVPPLPSEHSLLSDASSPPDTFTPLRKLRKHTSDEFELDPLSPKNPATNDRASLSRDEKSAPVRKHRSSGSTSMSSTPRDRNRDRRRESLVVNPPIKPVPPIESNHIHTRQLSTSSSSASHDTALLAHSRRAHTTDFSQFPSSPPTNPIQPFRRHAGNATTTTPPLRPSSSSHKETSSHQPHSHVLSNVAHSLLRGTQEGWSAMDEVVYAEELRKIDGLSTKTARARASIGSLNRMSRPGTPGSTSGRVHRDSVNESSKVSRKGSTKDKDKDATTRVQAVGHVVSGSVDDTSDARAGAVTSGDEHHSSSGCDKTPKKSISARLSFTPKRGSASSTTYTTTPTSSRDSASLSTATSATSISAPSGSGRYSTGVGKGRRNSAGSDISSVNSGGDATLKDRTSSLAGGAEALEEKGVPPVPPLPKDLSNFRPPPQSSHGIVFPHAAGGDGDIERTVSLEVPKSHGSHQHESLVLGSQSAPETIPSVNKTPSKKWSFSNALNIKLTSSPSIASMKDKDTSKSSSFPLSPRSMQNFTQQLRKRASREHALSPPVANNVSWSPVQRDAMTSAASLASLSSVGSTRTPKSPGLASKTSDREKASSRPGTGSSVSNTTTSIPSNAQNAPLSPATSVRRHQSKRLTPSSIPFFRRSSSQSVHIAASNPMPLSASPTIPSAPTNSGQGHGKPSGSPIKESSRLQSTTPGSAQKKSSVLSLGLPSLLKGSSSRRNLHGDKSDASTGKGARDNRKGEKSKQDHKDRSESRISVLMGRKRGKASIIVGHHCFPPTDITLRHFRPLIRRRLFLQQPCRLCK